MVADIAYLQQSQQEINQLEALFARQRAAYLAQPMPDATQRVQWLKALRDLLFKEQQALIEAIDRDFSARSADETLLAEIMPSLHGIHYAAKRVKKWMKPARRASACNSSRPGPGGVPAAGRGRGDRALELSAVPLHRPADRALAAGNRVMIKMSESTPATGRLLKDLLARIFPEDQVAVVLGEVDVGVAFSKLPFDHLLFTGATSVGKHVMRAAAENLTPSPGAGRQVAGDRLRQRADEGRRRADRLRQEPQRRADLRRARLRAGTEPARRGIRQSVQGGGPGLLPASFGQPRLHRDHQRAPARPPPGLSRRRPREGRDLVPLFAKPQRRLPQTLLLNVSDDMESDAGGNLRPAAAGDPLRAPGRRPGLRQPAPRPLGPYSSATTRRSQQRVLHETTQAACV